MASFKYLIVKSSAGEWPRLGSKCEQHSVLLNEQFEKAVSGGFVRIEGADIFSPRSVKFSCFGESGGLKVKSREEDADLIRRCYNLT